MNITPQVNEGSTSIVAITFLNPAGVAETPATMIYTIRDVVSGEVILPKTTFSGSLASTIELTLTPAINRIVNTLRTSEMRVLTILATYSATDQVTGEFKYEVRNLADVTGATPTIP